MNQLIRTGIAFSLGLAFCVVAKATPVSWSNSSGSEADFSYSNGQNDNGLAGDPTTVSDGFQFTVNNFKAESTGDSTDTVDETIHVTLTPKAGLRISSISGQLTGDYSVLSVLDPASAGYEADFNVFKTGEPDVAFNVLSPPDVTSGAGAISDGLKVNIPSAVTGPLNVIFHATVHVGSFEGSAATAELKYLQLGVTTAQAPPTIPLPAAVATFPLGALVAGWARKRMIK